MPTPTRGAITSTDPLEIINRLRDSSRYWGPVTTTRNMETCVATLRAESAAYHGVVVDGTDAPRLLAEVITKHENEQPWHYAGQQDGTGSASIAGRDSRTEMIQRWASYECALSTQAAKLLAELYVARRRVLGELPALDTDGNPIDETVTGGYNRAWIARRDLYNSFVCHAYGPTTLTPYLRGRVTASLAVPVSFSDDVTVARQQALSRLDQAIDARCKYLFDGHCEPANQHQRAARESMLSERQKLLRAVRKAASVTAVTTAHTTALTAVNAVPVSNSPVWTVDGDPPSGHPASSHTVAYTRGTGKNKWKVSLHAHSSARSNAASKAMGDVLLDGFTDPNFEVANVTNRAVDGDLSLVVQRKAGETGHPAAGTYKLAFGRAEPKRADSDGADNNRFLIAYSLCGCKDVLLLPLVVMV